MKAYRGLVIRVTEIEFDVWAESYEEAVAQCHESDWFTVREETHEDQLVDLYLNNDGFQC